MEDAKELKIVRLLPIMVIMQLDESYNRNKIFSSFQMKIILC